MGAGSNKDTDDIRARTRISFGRCGSTCDWHVADRLVGKDKDKDLYIRISGLERVNQSCKGRPSIKELTTRLLTILGLSFQRSDGELIQDGEYELRDLFLSN